MLILALAKQRAIQVGALGRIPFAPGWYAYAGSAFGPGGLAARINRHIRAAKSLHWHIDYLRAAASPLAVWIAEGSPSREHDWASALDRETVVTIPGFGCSDCRCRSHLFRLEPFPARDRLSAWLGNNAKCIAIS